MSISRWVPSKFDRERLRRTTRGLTGLRGSPLVLTTPISVGG